MITLDYDAPPHSHEVNKIEKNGLYRFFFWIIKDFYRFKDDVNIEKELFEFLKKEKDCT